MTYVIQSGAQPQIEGRIQGGAVCGHSSASLLYLCGGCHAYCLFALGLRRNSGCNASHFAALRMALINMILHRTGLILNDFFMSRRAH